MTWTYLTNFNSWSLSRMNDIFVGSFADNLFVTKININNLMSYLSSDWAIRVYVILWVIIVIVGLSLKYPFLWKK